MLIAAMAGVRTQLAPEWTAMARSTTRKLGHTARAKALPAMPITATAAAKRFERTTSTKAPPGTCPSRATRLPTVSAKPISDWVHLACEKYTARNGPKPVCRLATKNAKASRPWRLAAEIALPPAVRDPTPALAR
ncbi:hypothetical protein ACRAWG_13350 [Methylobacterium sp. P31]